MAEQGKQGTGKHGHKDTQEPWPHHGGGQEGGARQAQGGGGGGQESRSAGESDDAQRGRQAGSQHGGSEGESLKEREYRDKDGNVHHHTKAYMEQHNKK